MDQRCEMDVIVGEFVFKLHNPYIITTNCQQQLDSVFIHRKHNTFSLIRQHNTSMIYMYTIFRFYVVISYLTTRHSLLSLASVNK